MKPAKNQWLYVVNVQRVADAAIGATIAKKQDAAGDACHCYGLARVSGTGFSGAAHVTVLAANLSRPLRIGFAPLARPLSHVLRVGFALSTH
jgi:hypothetical protein